MLAASELELPSSLPRRSVLDSNSSLHSTVSHSIAASQNARHRAHSSTRSSAEHERYLENLHVPDKKIMAEIAKTQEANEARIEGAFAGAIEPHSSLSDGQEGYKLGQEEHSAAGLIQRNYRGYRDRRALKGFVLSPSARWTEAIKEAQYRNMTDPIARRERGLSQTAHSREASQDQVNHFAEGEGETRPHSAARENWQRVGKIARRAGGDERDNSDDEEEPSTLSEIEKEELRRRKIEQRRERDKTAKMMDLQVCLFACLSLPDPL
jgi:hypothetical protein